MVDDFHYTGCVVYVYSPELFEYLYLLGFYVSSTCRANPKHYSSVLLDEKVASKGRAAFYFNGPLTAGKWRDKRDVNF